MIGHAIPVYQGYGSQYGHGLGNVLGGLIRSAMPMVGKVAKAAGAKLLETGLDYVSKNLRKRKASAALQRRRQKTKRVKRAILLPPGMHKRKIPPDKPVSQKRSRDIFAP